VSLIARPPIGRGTQRTIADQTAYRLMTATGLGTFSAHKNADQLNIPDAATPITFDHAEYNPSNWYDTTLSRFTPKQHGYYRFSCQLLYTAAVPNKHVWLLLYKNGARYKVLAHDNVARAEDVSIGGTGICKSNGGDYWEIYTVHNLGAGNFDIIVPGDTEESNFFEAEFIAYQGS